MCTATRIGYVHMAMCTTKQKLFMYWNSFNLFTQCETWARLVEHNTDIIREIKERDKDQLSFII